MIHLDFEKLNLNLNLAVVVVVVVVVAAAATDIVVVDYYSRKLLRPQWLKRLVVV